MTPLLTRNEVAGYLGVTRDYLDHLALRGLGPPYIRVGERMVRYDRATLDAWIARRAVDRPEAA